MNARCQRCGLLFTEEEPVYDLQFGFVYPSDNATGFTFELDSSVGLFHGRCLALPERMNECEPTSGIAE